MLENAKKEKSISLRNGQSTKASNFPSIALNIATTSKEGQTVSN